MTCKRCGKKIVDKRIINEISNDSGVEFIEYVFYCNSCGWSSRPRIMKKKQKSKVTYARK